MQPPIENPQTFVKLIKKIMKQDYTISQVHFDVILSLRK